MQSSSSSDQGQTDGARNDRNTDFQFFHHMQDSLPRCNRKDRQHNKQRSIKGKKQTLFPYAARRRTAELLDIHFHFPTLPLHMFSVRFILPLSWDQSRNIDAEYGLQHSACGVFDVFNSIWQLPYQAPSLQPSIDRFHHAIIKCWMT